MQLFIKILTKISEIQNVVKDNKNFLEIIAVLSAYTKKELGFMYELSKVVINSKGKILSISEYLEGLDPSGGC